MSELIRLQRHNARRIALSVTLATASLLLVLFGVAAAASVAPILDLNGDLPGREYAATFTEDDAPKAIVSPSGLTITDEDSSSLTWAKVTLDATPDGALEALSADPGATGIVVKYKPASGVLDLTGVSSLANYQQVLRTVTYVNTSQGPDTSDRTVLFELNDGTVKSDPITSTVTINAVNDAPILDNTGMMMLADINENAFDTLGNKVETIVASAGGDRITDPDRNALEGIAVIEVGSSNGAWQYSLDAGTNWLAFENVSNESAVLLTPAVRIRFVPKAQFSGSASITFRAWDQTFGSNGDTDVDVTKNGGTSAFSTATDSASINVISVDDPPVVDLNGTDPGVNFNAGYLGSNVPVPAADQDATIVDPDSQTLSGATFRLTNPPDGALESLTVDVSATGITLEAYDSTTGYLILKGPADVGDFQKALRTVAYVNAAVIPSGGARTIEVKVNDGTSDSALATATIQINPDNQAPILSAPSGLLLSNVVEDTLDPPGNTIAAMLVSNGADPIIDPDPGALEGVALVGADNTRGMWQYATVVPLDGSPNWQPVGVISDTAAVLLNPQSLIRFVPAANYAGTSGSLTLRAWDQTSGTAGQRNVNASVNGGSTAFSAQTAVASLMVTAVNDPPIITYTPTGPLIYQEDSPPLPILMGTLVISDVDNANLASAMVTLVNRPDGDAEALAVEVGGSGLTAQFAAGVLQLTGQAPTDIYRQVLSTLTYVNASQDPDTADRQIQVTVTDGVAPSVPLTLTVGILAINDPPTVDLNGAAVGTDYSTTFYIQWRPVRVSDPNMVLVDQDDTSLQSVTVRLVNPLDGAAENLTARVTGTNISQTYDAATGNLMLTGVDSVSNYQRVLRTVTYNNVLESPSPNVRTVEFQAQDSVGKGPVSQTVISIQPTPTAYLYMPIVGRRSEEPNDVCTEAPATPLNRDEAYFADDRNDWFYFDLPQSADVVVRLSNFTPGKGQLIVAGGAACDKLKLLGSNGDNLTNRSVDIGRRSAGRYYIWIINDGPPNTADPYTLRIEATP